MVYPLKMLYPLKKVYPLKMVYLLKMVLMGCHWFWWVSIDFHGLPPILIDPHRSGYDPCKGHQFSMIFCMNTHEKLMIFGCRPRGSWGLCVFGSWLKTRKGGGSVFGPWKSMKNECFPWIFETPCKCMAIHQNAFASRPMGIHQDD